MRKVFGLIGIWMMVASAASAQEVTAEAWLDTTRLLIGDQVALHIAFTGPAGTLVKWPAIPDTIYNNVQVILRAKPDTAVSQDRRTSTISQRLLLTSFDSGFYSIPPIHIYYRVPQDTATKLAETQMVMFEVTAPSVDTTQAIKPIKGPIRVPLTFREILPWLLLGLGVAALVALVVWYLRRRKKNAPIFNLIPKVELKPHEVALAALEQMRQQKPWQSGRLKEFHSDLTEILRKYIEERFRVRALESTTDEIMDGMQENGGAGTESLTLLRRILVTADLVKFAKARPLEQENEESLALGIQFVKDTIPAPQTAAPATEP